MTTRWQKMLTKEKTAFLKTVKGYSSISKQQNSRKNVSLNLYKLFDQLKNTQMNID